MSFPLISTLKENIFFVADLTSSHSCIILSVYCLQLTNVTNTSYFLQYKSHTYMGKKGTDFQGSKPKKEVSPKPLHHIKS